VIQQSNEPFSLDFVFHAVEILVVIVGLTAFFLKMQHMAEEAANRLNDYMKAQRDAQTGINRILDDHEERIRENEKAINQWDGYERRSKRRET